MVHADATGRDDQVLCAVCLHHRDGLLLLLAALDLEQRVFGLLRFEQRLKFSEIDFLEHLLVRQRLRCAHPTTARPCVNSHELHAMLQQCKRLYTSHIDRGPPKHPYSVRQCSVQPR